jgi:hypothetical protein
MRNAECRVADRALSGIVRMSRIGRMFSPIREIREIRGKVPWFEGTPTLELSDVRHDRQKTRDRHEIPHENHRGRQIENQSRW